MAVVVVLILQVAVVFDAVVVAATTPKVDRLRERIRPYHSHLRNEIVAVLVEEDVDVVVVVMVVLLLLVDEEEETA